MTTATVKLWGTVIGYVSMDRDERFARFEYEPDFVRAGIELAPLTMPKYERSPSWYARGRRATAILGGNEFHCRCVLLSASCC